MIGTGRKRIGTRRIRRLLDLLAALVSGGRQVSAGIAAHSVGQP